MFSMKKNGKASTQTPLGGIEVTMKILKGEEKYSYNFFYSFNYYQLSIKFGPKYKILHDTNPS